MSGFRREGLFTDRDGFPRFGRIGTMVALAVVGGCYGACSKLNDYEYSSGARTGMINKFSRKGLIWKTYEGQMALEGIASSGNSIGANVWDFSIDNQARHGEDQREIAKKVEEALDSGQKVKVTYSEAFGHWPWRGRTGYFVLGIEPVKKPEKQ